MVIAGVLFMVGGEWGVVGGGVKDSCPASVGKNSSLYRCCLRCTDGESTCQVEFQALGFSGGFRLDHGWVGQGASGFSFRWFSNPEGAWRQPRILRIPATPPCSVVLHTFP